MIFPGKATFPIWPPKAIADEILHRAKSFLGPPQLLTTYKAFVHSLMEYCSPLWAGALASHLSWLHAVETKALRIIGICHDEAECLGLSFSHCRQVGGLSVFCHLISGLAPPCSVCDTSPSPLPLPIFPQGAQGPPANPSGKTTKITAHLHPFIPVFPRLWNKLSHSLQSHSSSRS